MLTCVLMAAGPAAGVSPVIIDYPPENALFPSDVFAPTFLWRDPESSAAVWRIEVTFAGRSARKQNLSVVSQGEKPPLGAIDENCTKAEVVTPEPEPGQAGQHSWRPPDDVWKKIKRYSTGAAATLTITGFLDPALGQPVSRAGLHIRTSSDPVGAPVFFRDHFRAARRKGRHHATTGRRHPPHRVAAALGQRAAQPAHDAAKSVRRGCLRIRLQVGREDILRGLRNRRPLHRLISDLHQLVEVWAEADCGVVDLVSRVWIGKRTGQIISMFAPYYGINELR